jgi:hypothetical protein
MIDMSITPTPRGADVFRRPYDVEITQQTAADWAAAIREREPVVRAFAWLDLERARRLSASARPGPLHGQWVGIT